MNNIINNIVNFSNKNTNLNVNNTNSDITNNDSCADNINPDNINLSALNANSHAKASNTNSNTINFNTKNLDNFISQASESLNLDQDLILIKKILQKLVSFKSISPHANGAIDWIANLLEKYNFTIIKKTFNETENLYAEIDLSNYLNRNNLNCNQKQKYKNNNQETFNNIKNIKNNYINFCFGGHIDIVPPLSGWDFDPFILTEHKGFLYGRGVTDMKGAVAVMLYILIKIGNEINQKINKKPRENEVSQQNINDKISINDNINENIDDEILKEILNYFNNINGLHKNHSNEDQVNLNNRLNNSNNDAICNSSFSLNQNTYKLSILLTSDEEGSATDGIKKMLPYIKSQGYKITHCLLGEPTSINSTGDNIKTGRKGSANFSLTISGTQGHVAYPTFACNPNLFISIFFYNLYEYFAKFDQESIHFEITELKCINETSNIIPDYISARFNFRYNYEFNCKKLEFIIYDILQNLISSDKYKIKNFLSIEYSLEINPSAESFLVNYSNDSINLQKILENAIFLTLGHMPSNINNGGTSDARFIKNYCKVIELGTMYATAHKKNEHIYCNDLKILYNIYSFVLKEIFNI